MKLDLTGKRFGRLVAIEDTGEKTKSGHNCIWLCLCDCGNYIKSDTGDLRSGTTKSCGCLRRERMGELNKTHGGRNDRLYLVWMDMRRRCRDEKDVQYKNYGGRGIKVCNGWNDYAAFRKWAYQTGYDDTAQPGKCTLDRIDGNGDYCPENCRWVSMVVQANNKRNNLLLTANGKTMTAAQWERFLGLPKSILSVRKKAGWSDERALFTPPRKTIKTNPALL